MQNHYIIHKTIHHSPLLTLIFLHILSTRAANDRPYTLSSFPSHFVGATIGRPLSHILPVRWHMTALPSFRMGDYWSPVIPYTSPLGRPMTAPTSRFVGATIGRPLTIHKNPTIPSPSLANRHKI